ncbi:MAG: hypothetical protein RLZZ591_384, partial [Pseudomonadota bacterium]
AHRGLLQATVGRSGALLTGFTVDWHVEPLAGVSPAAISSWFAANQNALSRTDGMPSGRLTFQGGQVEANVQVLFAGNANLEADRLFRIVLDNPGQGASIGTRSSTAATLDDDDARFEMGAATLVHEEGHTGGTSYVDLTINRTGDPRQAAVVNWAALGSGSAPANSLDLVTGNSAGTVVFAAGATSATLRIVVNPDDTVEPDEALTVTLTGTTTPHHAIGTASSTVVTLRNDDYAVSFDGAAGNLTQSKDEDGASPFSGAVFTFNVVRTGDLRQAVTVPWSIPLSGTLTAGDFVATSGTVSFAANSGSATITVTATNDRLVEANEGFSVVLQPPSGSSAALGAHSTATGTLVNDDVAIVATLVSAKSEGAGSPSTYTYTLTREGDTSRQASDVNWTVAGATVTANSGSVAAALSAGEISSTASGNLVWSAGDSSSKTITVTVANDQAVESDEAFKLSLASNGSDRSDLRANGTAGVVHDDDVQVAIVRLSDASVIEGAQGSSQSVSFRVWRKGDLSSTLTVDLQTSGVTGATGPTSVTFTPVTPGTATVTLANGTTQSVELRGGEDYIDVTYVLPGNDVLESNRTFTVTLANPVATADSGRFADQAVIDNTRASASLTVDDDDDRIVVTVSPVSVAEGNSGTTVITYTLTRSGDTTHATTVNWRVMPGAGLPVNADDFTSGQETTQVPNNGMPSGSITFNSGETSETITVNLSGDTVIEADELLVLALTQSGNTEVSGTGAVTVLGDDVGYNVIARASSLDEGNDPAQARWMTFDVVRAGVSAASSVNWTLAGLTAGDIETIEVDGVETAVSSLSFTGASSDSTNGTLAFANGQTGAVIRVKLKQDAIPESDETATLSIDASGTPSASTTVVNDDTGLSVTAVVASVVEGSDTSLTNMNAGTPSTQNVVFTVARTGNLALTTSVNWAVLAQGGITAADFDGGVLPTGSLTFNPTQDSLTVTVKVREDWNGEADEALTLQLSNPSAGTDLTVASAITTIVNDDATVAFANYTDSAAPLSHDEGDSDWVDYTFTVSRTGNTTLTQVVGWRVVGDDPITYEDFYDVFVDPDDASPLPARLMPFGTVTFSVGDSSKEVTLKIRSQTFAAIAESTTSQQEADELFEIELYNPIDIASNLGLSVAETGGSAWGEIVNDDVRIQVTSIITSKPEGRDPALNDGDVNADVPGTQRWITHSITVKRTGDLGEAVSFEWYVDKAGFADRMLTANASGNLLTTTYDHLEGTSAAGLVSGAYVAGTRDATTGLSAGELSGRLSWAANDASDRILYFTSIANDVMEPGYRFDVKVRPNPADTAGSARIDEFSLGMDLEDAQASQDFTNQSTLKLATIVVQRDETELWISNEMMRRYNPATSSYQDDENHASTHLPTGVEVFEYEANGTMSMESGLPLYEGTVITAAAGTDFVSHSGTLTFSEANRVRTVQTTLLADGTTEPYETFSLFLNDATHANVGTDQARQTIRDGDGTLADGRRLDIIGTTGIEGMDRYVTFRATFGQALTQENIFRVSLGDPADPETGIAGTPYAIGDFWNYVEKPYQNSVEGTSQDYLRYLEYSTDQGATWQSTAPTLHYTFEAGQVPTQATTVQASFSFDNSEVRRWVEGVGEEDGSFVPTSRFDAWLDFSDLKAGQDLRVGGSLSNIEFPGIGAPLRDPTVDYYLVVERDGVYVDVNNDGIRNAGENTNVFKTWFDADGDNVWDAGERSRLETDWVDFDGDNYADANTEIGWIERQHSWWATNGIRDSDETDRPWEALVDFTNKKLVIQFNDVPLDPLDLTKFSSDDQIQIDLQALADAGKAVGTSNRVSTSAYSIDYYQWNFTTHNGISVSADNNGQSYVTKLEATRDSGYSGQNTVGWIDLTLGTSSSPQVYRVGEFNTPYTVGYGTLGFVNGTATGIHNNFTADPPRGAPRGDIWIPVRVDATIGSPEMVFSNTAGIGKIEGTYKGVATIDGTSNANNDAALEYFRALLNKPDLDFAGIQAYFDTFDPNNVVPEVKLVRFQVDWDQTGDPSWSINGLDPSVIIAPQTTEWDHLNLIKDIALGAGNRSGSADIALGNAAFQWLREDGGDLFGAQLSASAEGGSISGPVGVRAPGSDALEDVTTVEDWAGRITVGAGTDEVLLRTTLLDDAIDEVVEELSVSMTQITGDAFNGNFASATASLVDDDSPQISLGTSVVRDPTQDRDFMVKVIDINNRAGDMPDAAVRFGGSYVYQSSSMINNSQAAQDFTITLRYRGDWDVAAFSEIVAISSDMNYNDDAGNNVWAGQQHSSPPSFRPLAGVAEVVNGVPTGFMLEEVEVPAGTYQLMLRSPVATISRTLDYLFVPDSDDQFQSYSIDDLTAAERALSADFSAEVTHVAPVIVARRSTATEAGGTMVTEVLAVGGDFADGDASVDYQTVDGGWQDKTFVISRERSSLEDITVIWELRPPAVLPEGGGDSDYVRWYFSHERIQPAKPSDFIVLDGQWTTNNGSQDVIRGYATLLAGEKEASFTIRVRADDAIEPVKDFSVAIWGERVNGVDQALTEATQPDPVTDLNNPTSENFVVVGNPEGYQYDGEGLQLSDLAATDHHWVGYGRIDTDDRAFAVKGLVYNEATESVLPSIASNASEALAWDAANQAEMAALRSTLPAGYSLHQFKITLDGSGPGKASVDWQLVVKGIDGTGGFNVGSQTLVNGVPTQADGAHQTEEADFLLYDVAQGGYDTALGVTWTTGPVPEYVRNGDSFTLDANGDRLRINVTRTVSEPKTVFFDNGETFRVVTLAIRDDLLREDAEIFEVLLLNPLALEGSSGQVQIDPLQGKASFLVGDNEGPTVKVELFQRQTGQTDSAIGNGGNFYEGSGGYYVGTTGSGRELNTQADVTGDATYPHSDNNLADDRRLVLKFTRSEALATSSQAFFEIKLFTDQKTPAPEMTVEGGANVVRFADDTGRTYYRGIADFLPGSSVAEVVFRVEDDFNIDKAVNAQIKLYDAEHLPENDTSASWTDQPPPRAGWDTLGIGDTSGLADWNITRRDPAAYSLNFGFTDDDTRLWLKAFADGEATTYSFDDDGDPANAPLKLEFHDLRHRQVEGDPTWTGAADQHTALSDGDFNFSLAVAGKSQGTATIAWEIVLNGTAVQADFNAARIGSQYVNGAGKTVLVGATSISLDVSASLDPTAGLDLSIPDLFVPNFTPGPDKTFDLVLQTPVTANGLPVFYAPGKSGGLAAPHPTMTIKVTLADDDVTYAVAWNSANTPDGNSNVTVREGDLGSTDTREFIFDVSRQFATDGFEGGSTVMWRVVPVNGAAVTAEDFAGVYLDRNGNAVLPFGTVVFSGQVLDVATHNQITAPELLETVRLAVRGDSQVEYGEQFRIELYSPSIGSVTAGQGSVTGVIVNDDTGLRVEDTSVIETDSGDVAVTVTLSRVGDLVRLLKDDTTTGTYDERITTVNWTANYVTTNATDRGTGVFSGTGITYNPNTTATHTYGYATEMQTISFNVKGDATVEADETLQVLLSGAKGIDEVLRAAGTVTVRNDDTVFSVIPTPTYDTANNAIVESTGGTWHYRITRSVATPQDQTVTWSVVPGGGRNVVDATDFGALPSGTVTFTGNELYKDITFTGPTGDTTSESDEVFLVEVSAFGTGAENDTFAATNGGAKGTVINDDAALYISDTYAVAQVEGTGSASNYRFEVVRAGTGLINTTTVAWALDFTGTGATAADFTGPTSGTLTFNADGRQTVSIAIDPDSTSEATAQDFKIRLSNAQGGLSILGADVAGVLEVTGELLDDDFTLSVANVSEAEGDGARQMGFTVTRTGSSALAATVNWALSFSGQTAASAADFSATSGNFVLPAGVTSYTFYVPVAGDAQWEADEAFNLTLDYNGQTATATGTLENDDVGFSLAPMTAASESSGSITFRILREGDLTGSDTVTWTVSAGTSPSASLVAGTDFTLSQALTGTASFAANAAYVDVTLNLVNDSVAEDNEHFTVTLSNPGVGASLKSTADATTEGTINNDDQGYKVTANKAFIVENGTSAGDTVTFTIDRYVTTGASTVRWKLEIAGGDTSALTLLDLLIDGAAATQDAFSGADLAFAAGEASKMVVVRLAGDTRLESVADLRMVIERATSDTTSTLVTPSALVQARDDDKELSLVPLSSAAANEGHTGTTVMDYQVTRTGTSSGIASATWTLAGSGTYPTSAADIDHIEVNGVTVNGLTGTVSFADGDMADKSIRVFVNGDTVGEFDETYTITLSSPATSTILGTSSVVQTVLNDDPALQLSMATTSVAEGNDGDDRFLSFRVTRTGDLSQTASVNWSVLAASSGSSVNVADFGGAFPAGLLAFAAGESEKTVTFQTYGDDTIESDEGLRVQLSNPVGANLIGATEIAATLVNDDATVSIAAPNPATVLEGKSGTQVTATFALSASGPTNMTSVLVNWHVEGTGLHPANGLDFVGGVLPSGQSTITMSSGSGTANVVITVAGDNIYGPSEGFKVVLDSATSLIGSNVGGATLATREASVTVTDDDTLIGLSQAETHRYVEGDTGTTELRFYVDEINRSTDGPVLPNIRIDYTLSGDLDGSDVTSLTGTNVALTQDTSSGRYYLGVTLNGDAMVEGNERFTLRLDQAGATTSDGGGVEIAQSGVTVSGTVVNDDFSIQLTSSALVQNEDTGRFVFDLVRTGPTDDLMTVEWTLGTPTLDPGEYGVSANDFIDPVTGQSFTQTSTTALTGVATFQAGSSTARFTLDAAPDLLAETDERFALGVEVTQVAGASWTANADQMDYLTGTIANDDPLPAPFDPLPDQAVHLPLAVI